MTSNNGVRHFLHGFYIETTEQWGQAPFTCILHLIAKKKLKIKMIFSFQQFVGESNPCFRRERATS